MVDYNTVGDCDHHLMLIADEVNARVFTMGVIAANEPVRHKHVGIAAS